jgi:hypothetical protein
LGEGLLISLKAPALTKLELFSIPDLSHGLDIALFGRVMFIAHRYAYRNIQNDYL